MIEYKNIQWYSYQGALLPKIFPHEEINLTYNESKELLFLSKSYLIRYTDDWDRNGGEFWYIIKDKFGGMDELRSKHRTQVRKGIKNCIIKRVSNKEIATNGYNTYRSAFAKYRTNLIPLSKEMFHYYMLKSNYENWAVYEKKNNIMIGYAQNIVKDDACITDAVKFNPSFLNLRASEALFFTLNEHYLEERQFSYISNGARSMSHDTNIQDYLLQKFKYRKAFCRLNIYYRKDVGLIVNMLYPFRNIISNINYRYANSLSTLLKQEKIRRSYDK